MSESYASNTDDLASFLIKHMEQQHRNVTTVRTVRKATRSRASTVVTRKAVVVPHVRHTTWTYDRNAGMRNTNDDCLGGTRPHSVLAGGQLRLSDCHK